MRRLAANPAPIEQQYVFKDYFTYGLTFLALAPAGTATGQIAIQADSDFIWQKATFFADIAAASQNMGTLLVPLVSILITDSGAGRQLMNTAVPVTTIFGTGEIPFILPRPRIFRAQTVLSVQVSNFDAAVTYNLRLSFIGEKGFWQ